VGRLLGISSEAARQRSRRLRWRHQRANDGRTLVLLPPDAGPDEAVQEPVQAPVRTAVQPPVRPDMMNGEGTALRELLAVLRDQLAKAEGRAEAAEAERARLLELVATLANRHPEPNGWAERAEAAEAKATELQGILDRDLAGLREAVAVLTAGPKPSIPGRGPAPRRRRSWLARVLGA